MCGLPSLRFIAISLVLLAIPSFAIASSYDRQARASVCARDAAFADAARDLSALEADPDSSTAAVVRRSIALDTIAGDRSEIAHAADACPGESFPRTAKAIVHADLLRLWARTIALRAVDAPIFPSPYVTACHAYDLASIRYDAREAWVERDDTRGRDISRADLWRALGADALYAHVASLATVRLRTLGITSLPGFDTDERAWLAEASTGRDFALAALPHGEHCGPTYALYGVEPETAAYAPLRHREDGTRVTALR